MFTYHDYREASVSPSQFTSVGDTVIYTDFNQSQAEGATTSVASWATTHSYTASSSQSNDFGTFTYSTSYSAEVLEVINGTTSSRIENYTNQWDSVFTATALNTGETVYTSYSTEDTVAASSYSYYSSATESYVRTASTTANANASYTSYVSTTGAGGVASYVTTSTASTLQLTTGTSFTETRYTQLATSLETDAPLEFGTVLLADGHNEWLWTPNYSPASNQNTVVTPALMTANAASVSASTFWPFAYTSVKPWVAVGTALNSYVLDPGGTYGTTYTITEAVGTQTTTLTSGDYFVRDTYTTTIPLLATTTSVDTASFESLTAEDYATVTSSIENGTTYSTTAPQLWTPDATNRESYAVVSLLNRYSTTSFSIGNSCVYDSSYQGDEGGTVYSHAESKAETATFALMPYLRNAEDGGLNTQLVKYPRIGGFRKPGEGITGPVGTNLAANEGGGGPFDLYYPFTSSIQENVITPVLDRTPGALKVYDTDGGTWYYQASGNNSVIVRHIESDLTPHTGTITFSVLGADTRDLFDSPGASTVFGGHGVVPGEAESVYRGLGAYHYTYISANGATAGSTRLVTAFDTFTVGTGQVAVEYSEPAYIPNAGNPALQILQFERNQH